MWPSWPEVRKVVALFCYSITTEYTLFADDEFRCDTNEIEAHKYEVMI